MPKRNREVSSSSVNAHGDIAEVSVASSTPLKTSAVQEDLDWPASPVLKMRRKDIRPDLAVRTWMVVTDEDRRGFELELDSSDDEPILPEKSCTRKPAQNVPRKEHSIIPSNLKSRKKQTIPIKYTDDVSSKFESSDSSSTDIILSPKRKKPSVKKTSSLRPIASEATLSLQPQGDSSLQRNSVPTRSLSKTHNELTNMEAAETMEGLKKLKMAKRKLLFVELDSPINELDNVSKRSSLRKNAISKQKYVKEYATTNMSKSKRSNEQKNIVSPVKSVEESAINNISTSKRSSVQKNIVSPVKSVEESATNNISISKRSSVQKNIVSPVKSVEESATNNISISKRSSVQKNIVSAIKSVEEFATNSMSNSRKKNIARESVHSSTHTNSETQVSSKTNTRLTAPLPEQRKSTRERSTPCAYWTAKSAHTTVMENENTNVAVVVKHPKVSQLRVTPRKQAALKVLLNKQDNPTKVPANAKSRGKKSTAKKASINKLSVNFFAFEEAVFENEKDCQHATALDMFGLSAGFYRLPPGADTGFMCFYEDSKLYTVLESVISCEVDGIVKEFRRYDQIHIRTGVCHRLSNISSNKSGLLQYVSLETK